MMRNQRGNSNVSSPSLLPPLNDSYSSPSMQISSSIPTSDPIKVRHMREKANVSPTESTMMKRGRGRPRKNPYPTNNYNPNNMDLVSHHIENISPEEVARALSYLHTPFDDGDQELEQAYLNAV